jgi:hypothetical protein
MNNNLFDLKIKNKVSIDDDINNDILSNIFQNKI